MPSPKGRLLLILGVMLGWLQRYYYFFVVDKYLIRKIVVLTMFKFSVCEKVENEREIFRKQQEKSSDASRTGAS